MVATSAHLKLAFAWVTYLNSLAVDKLAPIMSENFMSGTRPASLGFPPAGKQEYLQRVATAPVHFNISLPKTSDIVENSNVVQFYTTSDGRTTHGFPWKNEYIFTFTFEGGKILSVIEFSDPTVVTTALAKEATVAEANLNCTNTNLN